MKTNSLLKPAGAILSGLLALAALAAFYWSCQQAGVPQLLGVLCGIALALASFCVLRREDDLVHDFFLPVILFAALGGFTWAVRGSSGFGAVKGCVFAGVMWGAAWWFIARNPGAAQTRRYASGWIVLALTLGIGLSGARGWMQWSSFFEGRLQTNTGAGEFVEISPAYGFIWLFIAGVPWAGIGACLLAWCAAERPLAAWKWAVRLFCGFGTAYFLNHLYQQHPGWFLPLYSTLEERYKDLEANPNLRRLMNDNGNAIRHMGLFLGFLLFELGRRDWRNVVLITTVGLLNGFGWALCQNWKWAPGVFGDAGFNWWRCWETSGGISIGIAYGVAYYLVNRPLTQRGPVPVASPPATGLPRLLSLAFGALSVLFIAAILVWYLVDASAALTTATGSDRVQGIAFAAVLLLGAGMYGYQWWKQFRSPDGAAGMPDEAPSLRSWLPRFGLLVLVAMFMMGWLDRGGERGPVEWWARYDYYFGGVALAYGILYLLSNALGGARSSRTPRVPARLRYPNLEWLTVYLFLLLVAASFLRGELPAWAGWFKWQVVEQPVHWYALLGPALLALFGIGYFLTTLLPARESVTLEESEPVRLEPNLERLGVYLGVLLGLGMSLKNGTRGWANIYLQESGTETYWGDMYWRYIGPAMLILLALILLRIFFLRLPAGSNRNPFPYAGWLLVLIVVHQNVVGQAITGPITNWNEMAFNLYYFLLFLISAVILYHYQDRKRLQWAVAGEGVEETEDSTWETPALDAAAVRGAEDTDIKSAPVAEPEGLEWNLPEEHTDAAMESPAPESSAEDAPADQETAEAPASEAERSAENETAEEAGEAAPADIVMDTPVNAEGDTVESGSAPVTDVAPADTPVEVPEAETGNTSYGSPSTDSAGIEPEYEEEAANRWLPETPDLEGLQSGGDKPLTAADDQNVHPEDGPAGKKE